MRHFLLLDTMSKTVKTSLITLALLLFWMFTGIFSNGDKFTGEFSYGFKEGFGVLVYQNGDKYEGEFKNNMFNGNGEMTRKDGTVEKGLFKNHVFVGDD